jgi:hypothetical protein
LAEPEARADFEVKDGHPFGWVFREFIACF